jgi:hypothetical protein
MSYIVHGRCQSGRRWFWYAALCTFSDDRHCDDPVCEPGLGGHAYGWEDTEDLALKAMSEAVTQLGGEMRPGCYRGNAPGRAGWAAGALKRINSAKRKARPPSSATDTGVVEYLYGAYWSSWVDDMTGDYHKEVIPFQITKKTPKRIYYIRSHRPGEDPGIGYINRQDLETDTRCPGDYKNRCEHGRYGSHGEPPGEISTSRYYHHDSHLFTTREAAEDHLFRADRERERERAEREPQIRQLRRKMANAHPDRGGTAEEFMAARERYERALRAREAAHL